MGPQSKDYSLVESLKRIGMPSGKMRFRLKIALNLLTVVAFHPTFAVAQLSLKLTYDKPAEQWTEALPVGNGRIGAMVFGGTEDERLQINESSLWGGGPHDYVAPDSNAHLDEIRSLIFAGKVAEAERLAASMMGQPRMLMPYQPFCDMRLHFPGHGQATEYSRDLDLNDATAETTYKVGSATFRREAFISFPDQVLVVRITASQAGQLALR
jgi:alpha-L-fucosidase 2